MSEGRNLQRGQQSSPRGDLGVEAAQDKGQTGDSEGWRAGGWGRQESVRKRLHAVFSIKGDP